MEVCEAIAAVRESSNNSLTAADYGWLKSFHSFSVPGFPAPVDSFGALRVINEDRVEPSKGFGLHGAIDIQL